MTTRPRLLDLYCGAGGAATGYHRAGFDVVGVDIAPQPDYPFTFVQASALLLAYDDPLLGGPFDAIHASPPCQFATRARMVGTKKIAAPLNLIPQTRERLIASGLPYIIENVEQAHEHLHDPLLLCGSTFGLKVRRHRLFESNVMLLAPGPCRHKEQGRPVGVYHTMNDQVQGRDLKHGGYVYGGRTAATLAEGLDAMGIDHITQWGKSVNGGSGLIEAIPPAYTEHLGRQLIAHLR